MIDNTRNPAGSSANDRRTMAPGLEHDNTKRVASRWQEQRRCPGKELMFSRLIHKAELVNASAVPGIKPFVKSVEIGCRLTGEHELDWMALAAQQLYCLDRVLGAFIKGSTT